MHTKYQASNERSCLCCIILINGPESTGKKKGSFADNCKSFSLPFLHSFLLVEKNLRHIRCDGFPAVTWDVEIFPWDDVRYEKAWVPCCTDSTEGMNLQFRCRLRLRRECFHASFCWDFPFCWRGWKRNPHNYRSCLRLCRRCAWFCGTWPHRGSGEEEQSPAGGDRLAQFSPAMSLILAAAHTWTWTGITYASDLKAHCFPLFSSCFPILVVVFSRTMKLPVFAAMACVDFWMNLHLSWVLAEIFSHTECSMVTKALFCSVSIRDQPMWFTKRTMSAGVREDKLSVPGVDSEAARFG